LPLAHLPSSLSVFLPACQELLKAKWYQTLLRVKRSSVSAYLAIANETSTQLSKNTKYCRVIIAFHHWKYIPRTIKQASHTQQLNKILFEQRIYLYKSVLVTVTDPHAFPKMFALQCEFFVLRHFASQTQKSKHYLVIQKSNQRTPAILTCILIVKLGYSGERLVCSCINSLVQPKLQFVWLMEHNGISTEIVLCQGRATN